MCFYINTSRLNQNQGSFVRFGAKLWNSIHDEARYLLKRAFKKHINYNCYKWLILSTKFTGCLREGGWVLTGDDLVSWVSSGYRSDTFSYCLQLHYYEQ